MTALHNTVVEHAGAYGGMTADEAAAFVSGVVRDPDADTRLVFTHSGDLVGMAMVGTPPAGGFRMDTLGGVHPAWRGRGLGRELLAWQLERARRIHRELAPTATWQLHCQAFQDDHEAMRLFDRFGLTPTRYWFDMAADTSQARAVPVPVGFAVRTYAAPLQAELHAAHMETFADHWGFQRRELREWVGLTIGTADFVPELSLLGYAGVDLAGYVLSYRDPDPERLFIGQVGVRRPWRRRGLAVALLTAVLRAAAAAGHKRVNLVVDADNPTGAVGVYERAGFTVEARAVTYAATFGGQPAAA